MNIKCSGKLNAKQKPFGTELSILIGACVLIFLSFPRLCKEQN